MPVTETITSFYTFTPNTTIYSSEVNSNFALMRGNVYPIDGSTTALVTNAYDLGSSQYAWRRIYGKHWPHTGSTTGSATLTNTHDTVLFDPSSATTTATLPSASGATGSSFRIINIGTSKTVYIDADSTQTIDGTLTVNLPAGRSIEIVSNGSNWRSFLPLDLTSPTAVKTTTYSIDYADTIVLVNATSGGFTVTLPSAATMAGKQFQIKRTDQTLANAVTIATTSSQTIDGATTRKLMTQYEEYTVVSDGSNWHVVSHSYPQGWTTYALGGSWTLNNPSYTGKWRRVGDSVDIQIYVVMGGAVDNTSLTINMPSGLTIDTAKLLLASAGVTPFPGTGNILDSGTISYMLEPRYNNTTSFIVRYDNGSGNHASVNATTPFTWAINDSVYFYATSIPITNWEP